MRAGVDWQGTIDDRYPSLDDSLSWPQMLARYEPVRFVEEANFLILRRRSTPAVFDLHPLARTQMRLGQPVEVPPAVGLLWAQIEIIQRRQLVCGRPF